ncbi:hypothetical protein TESG_02614 [Trichophyton tonsurans CBS 112818]|uniref:Uncharacterized protein n=2 Tax=Trichophyton TaxID=5550 RepID=F2PPJ0_TRIEC|nr:hypothetical protein TESG_02614 [Trichophyton tonsurans CBS 112818]EGE03808.1 hypothetical protein TEQG_02841 [Trichophyton equinum CBS 127.97]
MESIPISINTLSIDEPILESPTTPRSCAMALTARRSNLRDTHIQHHQTSSPQLSSQAPSSPCPPPARILRHPSPIRYQSTPPSSRCFADILEPTLNLSDDNGDRSNDVDLQVKLALIDLLNCSDIKTDQESRLWVQNKLMDTEHRLKARRRSRVVHC